MRDADILFIKWNKTRRKMNAREDKESLARSCRESIEKIVNGLVATSVSSSAIFPRFTRRTSFRAYFTRPYNACTSCLDSSTRQKMPAAKQWRLQMNHRNSVGRFEWSKESQSKNKNRRKPYKPIPHTWFDVVLASPLYFVLH